MLKSILKIVTQSNFYTNCLAVKIKEFGLIFFIVNYNSTMLYNKKKKLYEIAYHKKTYLMFFFCVIVLREFEKIFLIMQRNMLHCLRVDE